MNNKVLVAMSGGVDSSVAAYKLKQKGYECIGATMQLLSHELTSPNLDNNTACAENACDSDPNSNTGAPDNISDAKKVCEKLDIPFYTFDLSKQFKECVIDRFIEAYENGQTPNPCIECNKFLKFGLLFEKAKELGCDYIATGHYAVIERSPSSTNNNICYLLKRATDRTKDQSYFLYSLTQDQLAHILFPLGGYTKPEIRKIAEENGFVNAKRRDSQDVCFIPDGKYAEFIRSNTGRDYPDGDFIDINGNVLGRHKGIINYTIGQRKGLGVALNEPMYVKEVDIKNNTVTLARDNELFSTELYANKLNIIDPQFFYTNAENPEKSPENGAGIRVKAKIRYRHIESDATVFVKDDIIKVTFDEPQRAITKGQAVVLYKNDYVAGGGTII